MDNYDEMLNKIATDGIMMSPETVKLKSMELNREYCKFEKDMIKKDDIDPEDSLRIYQTWVGHKLAVYELTLGKILDALNALEDE